MKRSKKIGNGLLLSSLVVLAATSFTSSEINNDSPVLLIMFIILTLLFVSGLFFKIKAVIKEKNYWRNMFL